jgi:lipoic acid synthetase
MEISESQLDSKKSNKLHIGKPKWLKSSIPTGEKFFEVRETLRSRKLVTVCEEAKCPNIGKCWNQETATFMILGDTCTRACRFCHVKTGNPNGWVDANEPLQVAESCLVSGLKYVVITMVDRDDMPDGGASHVARVVTEVKRLNPHIKVELLAGDFNGNHVAIDLILAAGIDVYAHNIETVERLTPRVRDHRASYRQSLEVLRHVKRHADSSVFTKSGIMLGLGEAEDELTASLQDLRGAEVDFLTLGQYMRPSKKHLSIKRWVHPDEFDKFGKLATDLGFKSVASAPLVRSSYRAREFYESAVRAIQASAQLQTREC